MQPSSRLQISVAALLLLCAGLCHSCDPSSLVQGCRVEGPNHCVCGLGCDTTFHYATREQCLTASRVRKPCLTVIRGERGDPCAAQPCQHRGLCTQIVADPGYQCFCAGTRHFGSHCELRCPSQEEYRESGTAQNYPIQCIVI